MAIIEFQFIQQNKKDNLTLKSQQPLSVLLSSEML